MPGDLVFFDTPWQGFYDQAGDKTAVDHVAMYVEDFHYPGGIIEGTYYPPGTYDCVEACDRRANRHFGVVPRTLSTTKIAQAYEDCGLINDPYFFCLARVVEPTIGAVVYSTGPVDIILVDPDGFAVARSTPAISDLLYYSFFDVNKDEQPDDMITIATARPGIYTVGVVPRASALPTNIFSLRLVIGGQVTILADNVQIQDVPSQPYQFALPFSE